MACLSVGAVWVPPMPLRVQAAAGGEDAHESSHGGSVISLRSTKPRSEAFRSQNPRTESLNLVFWYQNTRLSSGLAGLYQKALDGQQALPIILCAACRPAG